MEVALPKSVDPASPKMAENTAPLRVLVLDDHVDSADILKSYLEFEGYRTDVAYAGDEACIRFHLFQPDVVLLDLDLPNMDGFEVANYIRRAAGEQVEIVAISGLSRADIREKVMAAGFDEYFIKPTDPELVITAVEQARSRTIVSCRTQDN